MKIDFYPKGSMIQFYDNKNLLNLVNFSLEHIDEDVFDDIIILISRTSLKKAENYLKLMEINYLHLDEMEIFNYLKDIFIEIYSNKNLPNLRGAFLELLSFNIFNHLYEINNYSLDCNVCFDDWCSSKTVDIALECDNKGLACECKISRKNFDNELIQNLLEIRSRSNDYFAIFVITLDYKREFCLKLREMNRDFNGIDIKYLNIIHRNNFKEFYSGKFEKFENCFN